MVSEGVVLGEVLDGSARLSSGQDSQEHRINGELGKEDIYDLLGYIYALIELEFASHSSNQQL